jgi:hypothetical protein
MSHASLLTLNRGFRASFQTQIQLMNEAARHGAQRGPREQGTSCVQARDDKRCGNSL